MTSALSGICTRAVNLQRPRREEVEFAAQDHGRYVDRGQFRCQRLEVEERLHKALQSIEVVDQPAAVGGQPDQVGIGFEPGIGKIHREQQVLQVGRAAENEGGVQGRAEPHRVAAAFRRKLLIGTKPAMVPGCSMA